MPKNKDRTENLIPYKPGESGNPKGRPKGAKDGFRASINRMLRKTAPDKTLSVLQSKQLKPTTKSNSAALASILVGLGLKGNLQAMKLIADQTEAKLPQEIELGAGEGTEIMFLMPEKKERKE